MIGFLTVEESLRRENKSLRDENDTLKEEIIQLKQLLVPDDWQPPLEFNLTAKESKVLSLLYTSSTHITRRKIFDKIYGFNLDCDEPDISIIQVFMCRIRKKTKPFGITIETSNNRGYILTEESREILKNWTKIPEMVN